MTSPTKSENRSCTKAIDLRLKVLRYNLETEKDSAKSIPVSAMSPEGHDVLNHSSHQEGVAGRVDGHDTKFGTFQAEACGPAECLEEPIGTLGVEAAPGVDGETWRHYGKNLETNLQELFRRLKRRAYRAKPVRRHTS